MKGWNERLDELGFQNIDATMSEKLRSILDTQCFNTDLVVKLIKEFGRSAKLIAVTSKDAFAFTFDDTTLFPSWNKVVDTTGRLKIANEQIHDIPKPSNYWLCSLYRNTLNPFHTSKRKIKRQLAIPILSAKKNPKNENDNRPDKNVEENIENTYKELVKKEVSREDEDDDYSINYQGIKGSQRINKNKEKDKKPGKIAKAITSREKNNIEDSLVENNTTILKRTSFSSRKELKTKDIPIIREIYSSEIKELFGVYLGKRKRLCGSSGSSLKHISSVFVPGGYVLWLDTETHNLYKTDIMFGTTKQLANIPDCSCITYFNNIIYLYFTDSCVWKSISFTSMLNNRSSQKYTEHERIDGACLISTKYCRYTGKLYYTRKGKIIEVNVTNWKYVKLAPFVDKNQGNRSQETFNYYVKYDEKGRFKLIKHHKSGKSSEQIVDFGRRTMRVLNVLGVSSAIDTTDISEIIDTYDIRAIEDYRLETSHANTSFFLPIYKSVFVFFNPLSKSIEVASISVKPKSHHTKK